MRGSVAWQTEEFWRAVDRINDGDQRGHVSSKFQDKQAAYAELDARGESRASSNVKHHTGLYDYDSKSSYVATWKSFGEFCKTEFACRDFLKITPSMAVEYLKIRVESGTIARSTLGKESSHLAKFGAIQGVLGAKNGIPTPGSWDKAIETAKNTLRGEFHRTGETTHRAFAPAPVLAHLERRYGTDTAAAARLYVETGARRSEINRLSAARNPINAAGQIQLTNCKHGRARLSAPISAESRAFVERAYRENGGLTINADRLRQQLNEALTATGQMRYRGGLHALRHTFATDRLQQLTAEGMPRHTAKSQVSQELGHNRQDAVKPYIEGQAAYK